MWNDKVFKVLQLFYIPQRFAFSPFSEQNSRLWDSLLFGWKLSSFVNVIRRLQQLCSTHVLISSVT